MGFMQPTEKYGSFISNNQESYDDLRFRKMRRAMHDALSKTQVSEYQPIQEKQAVIMADAMFGSPAEWKKHLSKWVFLWSKTDLRIESDRTIELRSRPP
jgi:hypothetical protein